MIGSSVAIRLRSATIGRITLALHRSNSGVGLQDNLTSNINVARHSTPQQRCSGLFQLQNPVQLEPVARPCLKTIQTISRGTLGTREKQVTVLVEAKPRQLAATRGFASGRYSVGRLYCRPGRSQSLASRLKI